MYTEPLINNMQQALEYVGGAIVYGKHQAYSNGVMCLSEDGKSIFMAKGDTIEQISLELSGSETTNTADMPDMKQSIQSVRVSNRVEKLGMAKTRYRVCGLKVIDGELVANAIDWYDAGGNQTNTTIIFRDASDLNNCVVDGPFQMSGAARATGSISKVPDKFKGLFIGRDYIGINAFGSIASRLSSGPCITSFSLDELNGAGGTAKAGERPYPFGRSIFNYPTKTDTFLYSKGKWPESILPSKERYNTLQTADYIEDESGDKIPHSLWSIMSRCSVGFMIPESRTVIFIGVQVGTDPTSRHGPGTSLPIKLDGIQYKNGSSSSPIYPWVWNGEDYYEDKKNTSNGYSARVTEDRETYYWLYDANDIEKVNKGEIFPHDIRPYQHGRMPNFEVQGMRNKYIPFTPEHAYYDSSSETLYFTCDNRVKLKYSSVPVMLAFKLNKESMLSDVVETEPSPEPSPEPEPTTEPAPEESLMFKLEADITLITKPGISGMTVSDFLASNITITPKS